MPSRPIKDNDESTIPIGLVLITFGSIILFGVLAIWWLASRQIPMLPSAQIARISNGPLESTKPSLIQAVAVTPTPDPNKRGEDESVVLPESPLEADTLPSFSTVENAPTIYEGLASSQPDRLVIPSLGVDVSVQRVTLEPKEKDGERYYQWQVPGRYEVGWHENSAPLGQPGNTVLNGHNNIYGEVFRDLVDLEIGEEIVIYHSDRSFKYRVTQQEIMPENGQPLEVRFENARWIKPTSDERITLVTCYPYTTNSHRLVVIAKPVARAGS